MNGQTHWLPTSSVFCCFSFTAPFMRKGPIYFTKGRGCSMSILQTLDKQYINGEWRDGLGAKTLQDINPYNEEVIAEFKMANLEDIDAAYNAAANAKKEWDEVNAIPNPECWSVLFTISKRMKKKSFRSSFVNWVEPD